jgi:hypothetical protein
MFFSIDFPTVSFNKAVAAPRDDRSNLEYAGILGSLVNCLLQKPSVLFREKH